MWNIMGTFKVLLRAGFVAMQAAGTAVEVVVNFNDMFFIR